MSLKIRNSKNLSYRNTCIGADDVNRIIISILFEIANNETVYLFTYLYINIQCLFFLKSDFWLYQETGECDPGLNSYLCDKAIFKKIIIIKQTLFLGAVLGSQEQLSGKYRVPICLLTPCVHGLPHYPYPEPG